MIGTRASVIAGAALLVSLAAFGGRSTDPAGELAARALVVERAAAVVAAADALESSLEPAVDAARRGAARVVAGSEAPAPELVAAADRLRRAEPAAAELRGAARALDGALRAWRPDEASFEMRLERGEIGSVASQLEATAATADEFAAMRRRSEGLAGSLETALAALEGGEIEEAERLAGLARTDHDALTAWENELLTLPVWIETTDAMIGDVETIIAATRAGDATAAAAAAAAFAARADEAATADRALRIAMSEGGGGVTAAPLGRLADILDRLRAMRTRAAAIRDAAAR